ncbi:MAG: A/G-specific adenine glycosylase [Francisellaceae bacterium]
MQIHFDIERYQAELLDWYYRAGRHDLPWQRDFDPYAVWVSEIMLQQTQVKTVLPYFERFLKRFKTVVELAAASDDEMMQYWAGLGYYARGRNLQKAARLIMEQYDGCLPDTVDALTLLPGIGLSTAHAILSIAFNKPFPIMDGNVKRVFARLFALDFKLQGKKAENYLWQLAHELMPVNRTQAYTQAQMDLGATICTRSNPSCDHCPLQNICKANLSANQSSYPLKVVKKEKRIKSTVFHLYYCDHELLLLKRPSSGIWGGLYVLPEKNLAIGEYQTMLCEGRKHSFSHYDLYFDIKCYLMDTKVTVEDMRWVSLDQLDDFGMPAPLKSQLMRFSIDLL